LRRIAYEVEVEFKPTDVDEAVVTGATEMELGVEVGAGGGVNVEVGGAGGVYVEVGGSYVEVGGGVQVEVGGIQVDDGGGGAP
jgi:hypothetical protein